MHLESTEAAAQAGKHVFLDKPIAHTVADGKALTRACADAGVVLAIGYQRRRENHFRWIREKIDAGEFGRLVQAECNISRDREGQFELGHWRYQSDAMPGGVMLQIGIHYADVLTYLMGPIAAVSGRTAQLVLPGDNPDVANLILEHESGAISNLTASYASASEYYLMNIYGKTATAYYTLFDGCASSTGERMRRRRWRARRTTPSGRNSRNSRTPFAEALRPRWKATPPYPRSPSSARACARRKRDAGWRCPKSSKTRTNSHSREEPCHAFKQVISN